MIKTLIISLFVIISSAASAQLAGKWKTIDDASGKPRSIVEITEKSGVFQGRIIHLFPQPGKEPDPICTKCEEDDPRHGQKIKGMEIIRSMKKDGDEFSGGNILDPESGNVYRCRIWIEGKMLKVRGYLGPFFRTQTWHRAE